jgi:hypothetical protein
MFRLSRLIWMTGRTDKDKICETRHREINSLSGVDDRGQMLKAAHASRKKSKASSQADAAGLHLRQNEDRPPTVRECQPVTQELIYGWLNSPAVRGKLNPKQFEIVQLVADRILAECGLVVPEGTKLKHPDKPLVWLGHGAPGTSKTTVLLALRQLFEIVGYKYGVEYEVMAFQGTNAAAIGGKTIHNACGLSLDLQKLRDTERSQATAKRIANWRWVLVDEVGMVSACLLAHMELRLQRAVPKANQWKSDDRGLARPFAGVNVVFLGDFGQLDPPEGGAIHDFPADLKQHASASAIVPRDPLVDYGRDLFWKGAVQGVTELVERERCKDAWWNEVVDQFRDGCLSDANYNYLHGIPVEGCTLSQEERDSRRRLITGDDDPRLQEGKFAEATAIVANNDALYQINKDRAEAYGRAANAPMKLSVAEDRAKSETLQNEDCDKKAKTRWLTYHHRDTGNLPGLLHLAPGMPVALTDHIDRSSDKQLLKGRIGRVHSWHWPQENDRLPEIVPLGQTMIPERSHHPRPHIYIYIYISQLKQQAHTHTQSHTTRSNCSKRLSHEVREV